MTKDDIKNIKACLRGHKKAYQKVINKIDALNEKLDYLHNEAYELEQLIERCEWELCHG